MILRRQQQVNDGCFGSLEEVPTQALTLTITTLLSGNKMICTVPGSTKTKVIENMLKGPISVNCPAAILREHLDAHLVVDSVVFKS